MSSVNIFNTGKSGLFASRAALATTGHNIANVNTDGYSRQRVEQTTAPPNQIGNTIYGTGTKVKNIHRINDEFLTRQLSNEMKLFGQYEEKDLALTQAENVFNEIDNAGLNRLLSKFFNEFRKLGNEPESEAMRATVRESAEQLIGDFRRISRNLRDIQKNIDIRLDSSVRQANELVLRIADLNEQIKKYELHGGQAADLRDARDLAVKKLATIVDISVATNEKNDVTIAISGVGPLVCGQLYNKLYIQSGKSDLETGSPEGSARVYLENLGQPNITDRLSNGRLGGLVEARDKTVGAALRRIDELAYTLANKMNEIHQQGYTMSGKTGVKFFKTPTRIL